MTDFKKFTGTSKELCRNRQNIQSGKFLTTSFVYKNERVIRKDSSDHPDFLGPVFLHKEATFHKLVASCVLCPAMLAKNPHMILRHIKF